jgi:hypothetical protein
MRIDTYKWLEWWWKSHTKPKSVAPSTFAPPKLVEVRTPNVQTLGDVRRLLSKFANLPDDCPARFSFNQGMELQVTLEVIDKPTKQGPSLTQKESSEPCPTIKTHAT